MIFILNLLVAFVFAVGENCGNPVTLWDKMQCQISTNPVKYQAKCFPQRLFPGKATSYAQIKNMTGVVVLYHGFTGCPDALEEVATNLQQAGYLVLIPLLPGQGINLGFGCDKPGTCVSNGNNPSEIPNSKEPYIQWCKDTLNIINQEISFIPSELKSSTFSISTMGLSLGGALATFSASLPGSPFQRVLVVNPFYSSASNSLDFMVKKCMSDANPVNCMGSNFQASVFGSSSVKIESTSNLLGPFGRIINSVASIQKAFVNWLGTRTFGEILHKDFDGFLNFLWNQMETISDSSVLQKIPLLDGEYGWGEGCFSNKNRGGICAFRTRQLLSMQAFIAFTVGNLEHFPASVAYANIHSDIDGASRDSVAFAVTQKLASQGSVTTRCRYQLGCTFDKLSLADNTCGVPHSSFSHAEALVNAPFNLYWESDLLQNTLKFVGGSNRIGSGLTTDSGVCMTTTTQIGYGGQFDQVGPKYLKECKDRYFRKKL